MLCNRVGHQVEGTGRNFLKGSTERIGGRGGYRWSWRRRRVPAVQQLALLLVVTFGAAVQGASGGQSPAGVRSTSMPSGSHLDPVAAAALATPAREATISARLSTPAPDVLSKPQLFFTEVGAAAGIDFRYTFGDYAYDNILESSGSGVTWIDHDGDGDLDLYFLNGVHIEGVSDPKGRSLLSQASNRFYCNVDGGRFVDCTERTGLGDQSWSMAAVAGDVNDDGFTDLFVANYGANRLYLNNGDGTFSDRAPHYGLAGPETLNGFTKWSVGGVWLDADGDSDLDLAVCNFLAFDPDLLVPGREWEMPEPKEYAGQASQLFLQQPDGTFDDVTAQAGLFRPQSKCMGMTAMDFDSDGLLDLLQTNDHQPNSLFRRKNDGTYEEIGGEAGIAVNDQGLGTGSMHGTHGDVNGDGLIDFLVVDLRHGSLYMGTGEGLFADATWASGVGALLDGLGQWGAGLQDFDLDGDLDLFTTNGIAHILVEQYPMLASNDGRGHFTDARDGAGSYFQHRRSGRGASFADFDNDGDVDIVVNHVDHRAAAALLRNDSERQGQWMAFAPVGVAPKTSHGVRLTVDTGTQRITTIHQPVASYLSGNDPRVHVGLGRADVARSVSASWPSGKEQAWLNLPTDTRYVLYERLHPAP